MWQNADPAFGICYPDGSFPFRFFCHVGDFHETLRSSCVDAFLRLFGYLCVRRAADRVGTSGRQNRANRVPSR